MELSSTTSRRFLSAHQTLLVFSTTASFMRYSLIGYLNETELHSTLGSIFETLVDDSALTTCAQRLWDFFQGLFKTSFSKFFDLFNTKTTFSLFGLTYISFKSSYTNYKVQNLNYNLVNSKTPQP
jgi:hypothetical protein